MSDFDRGFSPRKPAFTPVRDETFDDSLFDQAAAEALPTDGRDGLPQTFRMRHDEHYVDRIMAQTSEAPVHMIAVEEIEGARPFSAEDIAPLTDSIASLGIIQPLLVRRRNGRYELIAGSSRLAAAVAAGLEKVPCLLHDVDDDRARAIAEAADVRPSAGDPMPPGPQTQPGLPVGATASLVDSLATIESCLNLFPNRERSLCERVGLDLMRAETSRARWLAEAWTLLAGKSELRKRTASAAGLVESALKSVEAEGRLAGVGSNLIVDESVRPVRVDSRLMTMALSGAIRAMVALLQGADGGTLKIRVSTHPAMRSAVFQLAQDVAPVPEVWFSRPGSATPADWSSDQGVPIALAAASRVAELHGGHLQMARGNRGGCSVTLVIPAGD